METQDIAFINQRFDSVTTLMTTQFKGINDRLDKINGRVGKAEDNIQSALLERGANRQKQEDYFSEIDSMREEIKDIANKEMNHVSICPVIPKLGEMDKRVRVLEDSNLATITRKSLVVSILGTLAVVISITVGMMKITESTASENVKYLQMQNDSIMKNQQLLIKTMKNENIK